jgi:hypothetical protein
MVMLSVAIKSIMLSVIMLTFVVYNLRYAECCDWKQNLGIM